MSNTILIGAQWGDEGKGKIVDYLTDDADIVVRTQGGNNAGHTIILGTEKYVLHLMPSGILRPGKICVIGNGVVVDPIGLVQEITALRERGITVNNKNFLLSESAHLVMPYHRELDELRESKKGKKKIGTTKRGIGPAYGDKVARVGLRVGDLLDPETFKQKLAARVKENNILLKEGGMKPLSLKEITADCLVAAEVLRPFITNTVAWLHQKAPAKNLLFEGAQGTFLDIDHGTYPFVTSSNTTAGGASTGSGMPPHRMDSVIGVLKAYTTRVGGGALPTECPELGETLHGKGREFGATTGRARRCGWLDLVTLRYANMINGFDELAITNLDGLDDAPKIKVCTGYKLDGKTIKLPPFNSADWDRCTPVYTTLPGWMSSTENATSWEDLPPAARSYVDFIAKSLEAKVSIVSVGPARSQTIRL